MAITIGELAQKSGVKVPTIRYYERSGLLAAPSRSEKAQRQYQDTDVARLRFIRHTRGLGFETGEIRAMLDMTTEGSCEEIDVMTGFIEERIGMLGALKEELSGISHDIGKGLMNEALVLQRLSGLSPQPVNDSAEGKEKGGEEQAETEKPEDGPVATQEEEKPGSEEGQEGDPIGSAVPLNERPSKKRKG